MTEPPHTDSSEIAARRKSQQSADESQSGGWMRMRSRGERAGGVVLSRRQLEEAGWTRPPDRPRGRCRTVAATGARRRRAAHRRPRRGPAASGSGFSTPGDGRRASHLTAARRAGLRWIGDDADRCAHTDGRRGRAPCPATSSTRPADRTSDGSSRSPARRDCRSSTPPCWPPSVIHNVRRAHRAAGCLRSASDSPPPTEVRRDDPAHPQAAAMARRSSCVLADIGGGAHSFAEINVDQALRRSRVGRRPPAKWSRVDKQGRRRYLDCVWELADGRVSCSRSTVRSTPRSSRGGTT